MEQAHVIRANRQISDKPPADYFPAILAKAGPAAFAAQSIPACPPLLDVAAYKTFLTRRRALTAERLNAFLGVPTPIESRT